MSQVRAFIVCLVIQAICLASTATVAKDAITFDQLLDEAGLRLEPSTLLEEVSPPETPLFQFEKAYRHRKEPLEVWYAIRPLARMEIKYNDPHSSAPKPDHVFPLVFQALTGRLARHGHTPSRTYSPKKALETFNANWAAATLFDVDPALGTTLKQGMLFALHKNGKGDAYALFLFEDAAQAKPSIQALLGNFRFKDE